MFINYIICLSHDNNHNSLNNDYYVKSKNDLAYQFYNESVLENLHLMNLLKMLKNPKTNILNNFSKEEIKDIYETMSVAIISTDNKFHFDFIKILENLDFSNFKNKNEKNQATGILIHTVDIGNGLLPYESYMSQAKLII